MHRVFPSRLNRFLKIRKDGERGMMAKQTYTPRKLVIAIRDALTRDRYVTITDAGLQATAGTARVIGARVKDGKFEIRMLTGQWIDAPTDRDLFNIG